MKHILVYHVNTSQWSADKASELLAEAFNEIKLSPEQCDEAGVIHQICLGTSENSRIELINLDGR